MSLLAVLPKRTNSDCTAEDVFSYEEELTDQSARDDGLWQSGDPTSLAEAEMRHVKRAGNGGAEDIAVGWILYNGNSLSA